ncbi:MAG: carbon storage regulator CsrA [Clostridiales bacterium]|jgi:carbon storage regulator|nr:carbon storage regulator CsrA [Clostridiales bacterium]
MLALTRKRGETIIIGDDIIVTVLAVSGDAVKIGIDAPRHIPVNRQEVYEQIIEQNKIAAETTPLAKFLARRKEYEQ